MHLTVRKLAASLVKQRATHKLQVLLKDHPQKELVKEVVPLLTEDDRQWFSQKFVKTEPPAQQKRTHQKQQNQQQKYPKVKLEVPAKECGPIEIVTKFNSVPEAQELPDKWVRFGLQKEGLLLVAEMKRKTFNRFVRRAEEFEHWTAAINGPISHVQGSTIYLSRMGTGIQVYEKKVKTDEPEDLQEVDTTQPEQ